MLMTVCFCEDMTAFRAFNITFDLALCIYLSFFDYTSCGRLILRSEAGERRSDA